MAPTLASANLAATVQAPKLLDQLRDAARMKGHVEAEATAMAGWCRAYILFHGKRHPKEMGRGDVGRFLAHVAATDAAPLSSLASARTALDFLYRQVLHTELWELPWPLPQ